MKESKGRKRLRRLVNFMCRLPKEANRHFDMGVWGAGVDGVLTTEQLQGPCGTKACALGWAGSMPEFQKEGLQTIAANHRIGGVYYSIKGGGRFSSVEAAMAFFDINAVQAHALFGGTDEITTPKQWAKHARKVMEL